MNVVIKQYEDKYLESLNNLLNQVYNLKKENTTNSNIEIVAITNDKVVGYLTINRLHDSVKNINYAFFNYVCVDKNYRNKGIASNMLKYAFDICRELNISYIELTSNSSRLEAQELYKNSGFVVRDTNVFRKELL